MEGAPEQAPTARAAPELVRKRSTEQGLLRTEVCRTCGKTERLREEALRNYNAMALSPV